MRGAGSLEERGNGRIDSHVSDLLLSYLVALARTRRKMEEAADVVVLVE